MSLIVSTSVAGSLGCGEAGGGVEDASLDARKDGTVPDASAVDGRAALDGRGDGGLGVARDAGSDERSYIDAEVRCEGGGAWGPCGVTDAAELACDASTDCTWQFSGSCCGTPTFGVNKSAPPLSCPAPPCPPPSGSQPGCSDYFTQDCQAVSAATYVVVDCVNHRCMTRAN